MPTLAAMADRLWRGETSTRDKKHHPFVPLNLTEEVADGVGFFKGFSNMTAVNTDDGVVLIDTGSFHRVAHKRSFDSIRGWTPERIHTAVYTHGHVDHAYGLPPFLEEAAAKRWSPPEIVGHSAIRARMDRYIETQGYNSIINERQFGQPIEWPVDPIYPTATYDTEMSLEVGGTTFLLRHGKGETDDHTWVYMPERRVLCTGDLFIWAAPNAGNPQKVQRYVIEWARALRTMAALRPEVLLPGHGLPVFGAERVQQALGDTAAYLTSIYQQTVDLMNQGASVDDLIHGVAPPEALAQRPYLQPIYDEPEFIVRTVHRCLGGWYSGVPSELKPARRSEQAREIVALAGGVKKLLERTKTLLDEKNFRMACHLVDWACEAEPDNGDVHGMRADVYEARAQSEASTMSQGVFNAAARESRSASEMK